MLNVTVLMGRLVADPELRQTPNDISVTTIRIAVDREYSKGQDKQVDFIDITAWRHTAEFISKYFSKGSMIAVQGQLHVDSYQGQDGVKKTRYYVLADRVSFCGGKNDTPQQPATYQAPNNTGYQPPYPASNNAAPQQPAYQAPNAVPQQRAYQTPNAASQQPAYQAPNAAPQQPAYQAPNAVPQQRAYQTPNAAPQQPAYQAPNAVPQQRAYQTPNAAPQQPAYSAPCDVPNDASGLFPLPGDDDLPF